MKKIDFQKFRYKESFSPPDPFLQGKEVMDSADKSNPNHTQAMLAAYNFCKLYYTNINDQKRCKEGVLAKHKELTNI